MPRLDAMDIVSQAAMATTLVKMLVDVIKLCWGGEGGHPPNWVPPIAALACGILILALLAIALGQDLTNSRVLAQTVLAGLISGASSIGMTELHKLARAASGLGAGGQGLGIGETLPPALSPQPSAPGGSAGNWRA